LSRESNPYMEEPADFSLVEADGGATARLTGDWTSRCLGERADALAAALRETPGVVIDLTEIGRCDTAGAFTILRGAKTDPTPQIKARPETTRLLELVTASTQEEPVRPPTPWPSTASCW
jgi:phospholipid/cholesterol/gamma-HCH transport system permease protein